MREGGGQSQVKEAAELATDGGSMDDACSWTGVDRVSAGGTCSRSCTLLLFRTHLERGRRRMCLLPPVSYLPEFCPAGHCSLSRWHVHGSGESLGLVPYDSRAATSGGMRSVMPRAEAQWIVGGLKPGRMGQCQDRNGDKSWPRLGKELAHKGHLPHKACSLHLVSIQKCVCMPGRWSREAETGDRTSQMEDLPQRQQK